MKRAFIALLFALFMAYVFGELLIEVIGSNIGGMAR